MGKGRLRGKNSVGSWQTGRAGGGILLAVALVAGPIVSALAIAPGSSSPFGPPKLFALWCACAFAAFTLYKLRSATVTAIAHARHDPAVWLFSGLFALTVASTATSIDVRTSIVGLYPEFRGLLLFLASTILACAAYTASITSRARASRWFGRGMTLVAAPISAVALIQAALGALSGNPATRAYSTLGNSSDLALWLAIVTPLAVERALNEHNLRWRILSLSAVGLCLIASALTLSRGGWIGLAAAFLAWVALTASSWKRAPRAAIITATGVAIALLVGLLLNPQFADRLTSVTDSAGGTGEWRLQAWATATDLTLQRPLLGWGPSTFRYPFAAERPEGMLRRATALQVTDDPHNILLTVSTGSGIAALLLVLGLLVHTAHRAWKARIDEDGAVDVSTVSLAAGLTGGFVAAQFHFLTLGSGPLFAVAAGLLLGRTALHRAASPSSPDPRAETPAPSLLLPGSALVLVTLSGLLISGSLLAATSQLTAMETELARGRWARAENHLNTALRIGRVEPYIAWHSGRSATRFLIATGEPHAYTAAVTAFENAGHRIDHDALLHTAVGDLELVAAMKFGRTHLDAAEAAFERAVALDPTNGTHHVGLGNVHASRGEWPAAISEYERALELSPRLGLAWSNLARAYEEVGRADDAERARFEAERFPTPGQTTLSENR